MGAISLNIKIIEILIIAFLLNLPLGAWRAFVKKYSISWFVAIHLAVPLIYFMRVSNHLPYSTIPIFVLSAVLGQFVGASIKGRLKLERSKVVRRKLID